MNCINVEPDSPQGRWMDGLARVVDRWNDSDIIRNTLGEYGSTNDGTTALNEMFYRLTGNMMGYTPPEKFSEYHFKAAMREIERMEKKIQDPRYNSIMGIVATTAANLEASPITNKFKRDIQEVANFETTHMNKIQVKINGHGTKLNSNYSLGIRGHLVNAIIQDSNISGIFKKRSARAMLDKIENIEAKIMAEMANFSKGDHGAVKRIEEHKAQLEEVMTRFGPRVNKQFVQILDTKTMRDLNIAQSRGYIDVDVDGKTVRIENQSLILAALESKSMMMDVGENLVYGLRGLENFVKTVYEHGAYKDVDSKKIINDRGVPGPLRRRLSTVLEVINSLEQSIKEGRYYPHMILEMNAEIISSIPKITENARDGNRKWMENAQDLESLFVKLENFMPDVAKARNAQPDPGYSMNALGVMKQYAMDVVQFNKIVHSQNALVNVLRNMPNDATSGKSYEALREYVLETFTLHMEGYAGRGATINNTVRWITGLEFVSKMGFSAVGAAARNVLSKIYWINHFGYKAWAAAPSKVQDYSEVIKEVGQKYAGFYYGADASSVSKGGFNETENLRSTVKQKDGKYVPANDTMMEKADAKSKAFIGSAVTKAGYLQQKTENHIRKEMFEFTFATMYSKMLDQRTYFTKMEMDSGKFDNENQAWEAAHEKIKKNAASFALSSVNEWAFDYSPSGKAKLMGGTTRKLGAVGQVIFQYMHYPNEFTFRQAKQANRGAQAFGDAKYVFMEEDGTFKDAYQYLVNNPDFRGAVYTAAMQAVVSYVSLLFASPVYTLVSNATLEKAMQVWEFMTAEDDEDREKANFGGGAVSLFTGPFITDMITIGTAAQLFSMPDDEISKFVFGYKDFSSGTDEERNDAIYRTLQPHIFRNHKKDLPDITHEDGAKWGNVVQRNFGLNPRKEMQQERKEYMQQNPGVRNAIEAIRESRRRQSMQGSRRPPPGETAPREIAPR